MLVLALASMGESSCTVPRIDTSEQAAEAVRAQDLGELPYHPMAYHLDLSIYAYQLYGQSLVWPFDPYYEEAGEDRDARMARVRAWLETPEAREGTGLERLRGPGLLAGLPDNPAHDPILYQYSRLHPWSSTLTLPSDEWVEYVTPREITSQVREAYLCVRTEGSTQIDHENGVDGTVTLYPLPARRDDASASARDVLLVFEGGTGDKGEAGQPASQSLMGLALLRATTGDAYDLHIAFRGSRSGSAGRAAREAISTHEAGGNPDWITDLGYREVQSPLVSATDGHLVSRGMSTSIASILPQLFHCLDQVGGRTRATPPTRIYVTGHSLGGALAQQFTSAVILGDRYGPGGDLLPARLRSWPWAQLKLITFGAPRVGNEAWAEALTAALESQFYREQAAPFDGGAIGVTDLEILPRLTSTDRPAAYRVLNPSDPITTDLLAGGAHVGHTVYLEEGDALTIVAHDDFDAHEPIRIRRRITDTLRDSRIPERAWAYHPIEELVPSRDPAAAGSLSEYEKLIDAVRSYYVTNDLYFDVDAFDRSLSPFRAIVGAE